MVLRCSLALLSSSFLLLSCAPDLPTKATSEASVDFKKLKDGFDGLEANYTLEREHLNLTHLIMSGRRIRVDPSCDLNLNARITETGSALASALEAANQKGPTAPPLAPEWETISSKLSSNIAKDCHLRPLDKPAPLRPKKFVPVDPPSTTLDQGPSPAFLAGYRDLLSALALYYDTLALAASGEDIAKQKASAEALKKTLVGLAGTAGAATGVGFAVGPMLDAVITIGIEIAHAHSIAERYDLIEAALVNVTDAQLEDIEDAVGLATLYLQSETARARLRGSTELALSSFNATPSQDIALSAERAGSVTRELAGMRALTNPAIAKGIASIQEAHATLRKDVEDRKGSFAATTKRLLAIASAATALQEVATQSGLLP